MRRRKGRLKAEVEGASTENVYSERETRVRGGKGVGKQRQDVPVRVLRMESSSWRLPDLLARSTFTATIVPSLMLVAR